MSNRWLLFISSSLLLCSCIEPAKAPTIKHYTLNAYSDLKLTNKQTQQILLINTPSASPDYQTKQMLYTTDNPYELHAFAKNQWNAVPTLLLQPLLVESLRNTHYFHAVIATPQNALADWRLDTKLLSLRQEFSAANSQIVLQMEAQIINAKTNKIIAEQQFIATVKTAQRNPQAGVTAANQAVAQLLQQIAKFVVANVSQR